MAANIKKFVLHYSDHVLSRLLFSAKLELDFVHIDTIKQQRRKDSLNGAISASMREYCNVFW